MLLDYILKNFLIVYSQSFILDVLVGLHNLLLKLLMPGKQGQVFLLKTERKKRKTLPFIFLFDKIDQFMVVA